MKAIHQPNQKFSELIRLLARYPPKCSQVFTRPGLVHWAVYTMAVTKVLARQITLKLRHLLNHHAASPKPFPNRLCRFPHTSPIGTYRRIKQLMLHSRAVDARLLCRSLSFARVRHQTAKPARPQQPALGPLNLRKSLHVNGQSAIPRSADENRTKVIWVDPKYVAEPVTIVHLTGYTPSANLGELHHRYSFCFLGFGEISW